MIGPPAYLPGLQPPSDIPLQRFLPPVPSGMAAGWLAGRVAPGSWVLDPFGASPDLALEMARAGYRVLVTANNPIVRLVLELLADPPAPEALQTALAHLAAARLGDERLEPHLLSLYLTPCASCGALIPAEAFLWERPETDGPAPRSGPYARIYHCPHCGQNGEFPATAYDAEKAVRTAATPLHTARILERVARLGDPDRRHAEEALRHYPPRAVTALGAIVNRLETFPAGERRLLSALLLPAFDRTNVLWPHPSTRPRPKQLTTPPRYRELNVFKALEEAVWAWEQTAAEHVPFSIYPQLPDGGAGVCLFEGRIRDLTEQVSGLGIHAVVSALPRPNQAFWTLSVLWAGWLGGRAAVEPFKIVMRRQRYDWRWHTTALHAAFARLAPLLEPGTPLFTLVPECEPGLAGAALVAGEHAGLQFEGIALREADDLAQLHWRSLPRPAVPPDGVNSEAVEAVKSHLEARGEPAPLLPLVACVFEALSEGHGPEFFNATIPSIGYAQLLEAVSQTLSFRNGFLQYNAGKELDTGLWWLRSQPDSEPLADRLEAALIDLLRRSPNYRFEDFDNTLCSLFPGLLTPHPELIAACLASYAVQTSDGRWQLRPEDKPALRQAEDAQNRSLLTELGERLGFTVIQGPPLSWEKGAAVYRFHLTDTARIGNQVRMDAGGPARRLVVLPGSRAGLVLYKRKRDPHLDYLLREWTFLKFRHLRALAANPSLTRDNFDHLLRVDELTDESPQLKFM